MTDALARRRNTLLGCLNVLTRNAPSVNVSDAMALLYVAENPGIRAKELADLMETTEATASRTARRLLEAGSPNALAPALGWLCMSRNERENISRHYFLTPAGAALTERLDQIIRRAQPINGQAGDPRIPRDLVRSAG